MIDRWVAELGYRPGWRFKLGGPGGRWLCMFATTTDTVKPNQMRTTQFMFEVPDVADEREFARWAFARLLDAERHEAAEWFRLGERRPFWPDHENAPYAHTEHW